MSSVGLNTESQIRDIKELLKKGKENGIPDNIKELIEEILKILHGGISGGELKQLLALLTKLGAAIPSELLDEIMHEIKDSLQSGEIDPKIHGHALEAILNFLSERMLDNIPFIQKIGG